MEQNNRNLTHLIEADQPITIIFEQIEEDTKLATVGWEPSTTEQIIKAVEALVFQNGKYMQVYRE